MTVGVALVFIFCGLLSLFGVAVFNKNATLGVAAIIIAFALFSASINNKF